MGMDDKRMRVFVYNVSTGGEMSNAGWMFSLVLLSEKDPQVLIFFLVSHTFIHTIPLLLSVQFQGFLCRIMI